MRPVTLDQDGLELTEICLSLSQDQLSLKDCFRAGGISRPLSEVKEVEEKLGTEEEQRGSLRTLRMNSIDKSLSQISGRGSPYRRASTGFAGGGGCDGACQTVCLHVLLQQQTAFLLALPTLNPLHTRTEASPRNPRSPHCPLCISCNLQPSCPLLYTLHLAQALEAVLGTSEGLALGQLLPFPAPVEI